MDVTGIQRRIAGKKMGPVFIVGCSRTGSTLLQNLLNRYTNIDILPEAQFLVPRWIHKDFLTKMRYLKRFEGEEFVDRLIELMYSNQLFGVFWEKIAQRNLDQSYLKEILLNSERDIKAIFYAVMKTHAYGNGKIVLGAKFPVYICYTEKLLDWFENCLVIHTVRDPRAIFASQYYKRQVVKGNWIKKSVVAIIQFIHINVQFFWAAQTHNRLKNKQGYFCIKYEDLVQYPEETLKSLCKFLSIEFDSRMLEPRAVLNTSFRTERTITSAFQTSSIDAWERRIPKATSRLIELLHTVSFKQFGYSRRAQISIFSILVLLKDFLAGRKN